MPLLDMLEHDRDRLSTIHLTDGQWLVLPTDETRIVEFGPDWMIVREGHGEGAHTVYVPLAAIVSVTLR